MHKLSLCHCKQLFFTCIEAYKSSPWDRPWRPRGVVEV